ncbi:MAG: FG-GAP repeat domain-containing protein, partial [Phycisphaerales bacterium]
HLLHQDSVGIFSDITNDNPLAMFWLSPRGVSWQDVDLDGFVDLLVTNSGGDNCKKRLMINQGDNTFERNEYAGLDSEWNEGRGAAWCDYNNDGLADVYIVCGSEDNLVEWRRTNLLFKNNGDGTFTNVAAQAGVADVGHGRGVAWGDINNDGYMDLLIGNQVGSDHPGDNKLYLNDGDGTFTDISVSSGLVENVRTRCVSMADYNNDGLLDLYTVNFGTILPHNRLLRNNGDETFTDVAQWTLVAAAVNGDSATWTDYDNDGWVDLYAVGGSLQAPGIGQNTLIRNTNQNGNHWIEFE